MPTQITQRESGGRTYLQVEGDMLVDDALLLERIANDLHEDIGAHVTVDLADLDFLDSDSAPILKRLENRSGISIEGLEIFLQSAIDAAERNSA
jgi:anti-anti-sigma regulatory factor